MGQAEDCCIDVCLDFLCFVQCMAPQLTCSRVKIAGSYVLSALNCVMGNVCEFVM